MPDITKVSHGLTIGDAKYGNARPGVVEANLKPGETMEQALDELDDRLNAWHRKRYPHLYEENPPMKIQYKNPGAGWVTPENAQSIPIISKEKPQQDTVAQLIADIYTCESVKVLESYRIMAKAKPELQAAYDQQMKKLTT